MIHAVTKTQVSIPCTCSVPSPQQHAPLTNRPARPQLLPHIFLTSQFLCRSALPGPSRTRNLPMISLTPTQACQCGICHLQDEAGFLLVKLPRLVWFQNPESHIRFGFRTTSLVRFPPGDWMTQPTLAAPIRSLVRSWTTFPRRPRSPVNRH